MKLTKAYLKKVIKEELEQARLSEEETDEEYEARRGKSGPAIGLGESYTFVVYRPGHYRRDPSTTVAYVENVPMSMIDTEDYERNEMTHKDPERFLHISKESLLKLGFEPNSYGKFNLETYVVEKIPETVDVMVPYNLRAGEFMIDQVPPYKMPRMIDAGRM